jgi:prolyl oligopeptidase
MCFLPKRLERGGTFVQANIRGGGEFGPSWHAAALRDKRHKAYEDMEAVSYRVDGWLIE